MRRLLFAALAAIAIVLLAALAWGASANPERRTIDDAVRASSPGKFVTLSHGTTHYDVAGPDTGRVVVLVHGFSVPSYIWDSTSTFLSSQGFRVIRYDVYGRGLSDRPDTEYDGTLFDAQLAELLDSLDVAGPVDLMGLSFGGYVTGHFTGTHAARVRTLTLVDPVASSGTMPANLTLPVIGPWLWQTQAVPHMADGQLSDFLHPERYPTWVAQYRPQMEFKGFGRALLRSRVTSSRTNYSELYGKVGRTGIPVLLVWGKQDQTVPIELASVVRNAIPQVQYAPIDSSGHLPHIEQARQVDALMLAFLMAHPASAP